MRALFKANAEHPGLIAARVWIQQWLTSSLHGDDSQPGALHVARLARKGVTGDDVLHELCSVWLYITLHQRPDDERATFALAVAMLALAPRDFVRGYTYPSGEHRYYRDASHRDRQAIGDHLRLRLAPLFVRIVVAIEERRRRAADMERAVDAGFYIPQARRKPRSKKHEQQ